MYFRVCGSRAICYQRLSLLVARLKWKPIKDNIPIISGVLIASIKPHIAAPNSVKSNGLNASLKGSIITEPTAKKKLTNEIAAAINNTNERIFSNILYPPFKIYSSVLQKNVFSNCFQLQNLAELSIINTWQLSLDEKDFSGCD